MNKVHIADSDNKSGILCVTSMAVLSAKKKCWAATSDEKLVTCKRCISIHKNLLKWKGYQQK